MRQASSPLLTLLLLYMRTFPFNIFLAIGLLSLPACHFLKTDEPITPPREKTTTQTASPWKPELDVRADVAIIYGTKTQKYLDFGDGEVSFEQRVQSWKNQNYNVHFMTGISWGEYEEYLSGNWDGKIHKDESQQSRDGSICWHHDSVPYLVPTASFTRYLKQQKIRRIIDTGIDALYLAEPEFLNAAGYSPAFRREWQDYYGFPWRPQHTSAENAFLSNKLKYHLFYRALDDCFTFAKQYGKHHDRDIRCYVSLHSLINYTQWSIVSPEASLASLPCVDGYVAQVWAGTARLPNYFNGISRERIFETAFLEYGSLESMTAPTGRKLFFLTDPLEDWPRNWEEYLRNYESIYVAQLLYPRINNYEIMPWPERIYEGEYQTGKDAGKKSRIPSYFSTQMQVMVQALNDMPLSDNVVEGSQGISVLMANSLMFQSLPEPIDGYDDPQMSNFFGLTMPFLKRGIPVSLVHLENVVFPETLAHTRVLLMSYANLKPLEARSHRFLADWVEQGGSLVYVAEDSDPFQTVREWWNTGDNHWKRPSDHLFSLMGIPEGASAGTYPFGKGAVTIIRQDPKVFVLEKGSDESLISCVNSLYTRNGHRPLRFKNHLKLERGMYDLIAVLDESIDSTAYEAKGLFIDLFNPELPILSSKSIAPGRQAFLLNFDRVPEPFKPQVLASAARVYDEQTTSETYAFTTRGPVPMASVMRVRLPREAKEVLILNHKDQSIEGSSSEWDAHSRTYLLKFPNQTEGVHIRFYFPQE